MVSYGGKNIAYLYDKFKGIYRLKVPIDSHTNDYCRKLNGTYEDVDMYIDCQFGNKVFHFGNSTLQAYIPSLIRGHNIVKTIQQSNPSIIFDISETDSEVLFKFKYINSDKVIPFQKLKNYTNFLCFFQNLVLKHQVFPWHYQRLLL